jgi:adenylate cyclase class 2
LAVDEVDRLGQFVELEIVVEESQLAGAQWAIRELAGQLGLAAPERRSYLALLLGEDN